MMMKSFRMLFIILRKYETCVIAIFDLDGTLCDVKHRRQYVATKPRNWDAWNAGLSMTNLFQRFLKSIRHALKDRLIFFVSGRSDDYRDVTVNWLTDNESTNTMKSIMRKYKDHRDDSVVKGEIADEIEKTYNISAVSLMIAREWLTCGQTVVYLCLMLVRVKGTSNESQSCVRSSPGVL
jgi:hypothetical protein